MDVQHTKHVTYKLAYRFVWCPKYRKKILVGKTATFLEQEMRRICAENAWAIGAVNIQPDHMHLFLSAPPSIAPSQIAHTLKGTTARNVFRQFPEVKKHLWGGAVWSRSYYVGSVADMSVDTVLKYSESGQDYNRQRQKISMPLALPLAGLTASQKVLVICSTGSHSVLLDSLCRIIAAGEPSFKRKESLSHGTSTLRPLGTHHSRSRQRSVPPWVPFSASVVFRRHVWGGWTSAPGTLPRYSSDQ